SKLLKQLFDRCFVARAGTVIDELTVIITSSLGPAEVPSSGLFLEHAIGDSVPGHGSQELNELFRFLKLEFARCCPQKESGEDRLGDDYRIEEPPQSRFGQPGTDGDANGRLVAANQFGAGDFVPRANTTYQIQKSELFRHVAEPPRSSGSAISQ